MPDLIQNKQIAEKVDSDQPELPLEHPDATPQETKTTDAEIAVTPASTASLMSLVTLKKIIPFALLFVMALSAKPLIDALKPSESKPQVTVAAPSQIAPKVAATVKPPSPAPTKPVTPVPVATEMTGETADRAFAEVMRLSRIAATDASQRKIALDRMAVIIGRVKATAVANPKAFNNASPATKEWLERLNSTDSPAPQVKPVVAAKPAVVTKPVAKLRRPIRRAKPVAPTITPSQKFAKEFHSKTAN